MPTNRHLQWYEIKDFTAGLFDERGTSALLAPTNALSVLTDYVPLKQGGLRAFYKSTAVGTGGLASPSTKACMGLFARNGVVTRPGRTGGGADSFDAIMATIDTSDFKARLHRMDQSNDETTWKVLYTDAAGGASAGHKSAIFAYFRTTAGTEFYVLVLAGGTNQGLYTIAYVAGAGPPAGDGVTTRIQSWSGPMCISQARILVAGGNDANLHYSDVGATTFTSPATQLLTVTPNQGEPNISIVSPIEPADLLIGKEGAPWVNIAGDVTSTSTPVREMGQEHYVRQNQQSVPRVPGGIAFIEHAGRAFVTDGRNFQSVSDPISRFDSNVSPGLVGSGQMAFLNGMLFAPGGYVFDFATSAWFKASSLAGSLYHVADPYGGQLWHATSGVGFDVKRTSLFEGVTNSGKRMSSGTFRTMPFDGPEGRAVELREVQVFAQTYSTSTLVVKVIDASGNTVFTSANIPMTGRGMYQALIPNVQDEYLSIDVTCSADNGTSEAPTIERVRFGFGPGNLVK